MPDLNAHMRSLASVSPYMQPCFGVIFVNKVQQSSDIGLGIKKREKRKDEETSTTKQKPQKQTSKQVQPINMPERTSLEKYHPTCDGR